MADATPLPPCRSVGALALRIANRNERIAGANINARAVELQECVEHLYAVNDYEHAIGPKPPLVQPLTNFLTASGLIAAVGERVGLTSDGVAVVADARAKGF